jgi:hypothetical protein
MLRAYIKITLHAHLSRRARALQECTLGMELCRAISIVVLAVFLCGACMRARNKAAHVQCSVFRKVSKRCNCQRHI